MHTDAGIFLIICTDQQAPPKNAESNQHKLWTTEKQWCSCRELLGVPCTTENLDAATINNTTNCSHQTRRGLERICQELLKA